MAEKFVDSANDFTTVPSTHIGQNRNEPHRAHKAGDPPAAVSFREAFIRNAAATGCLVRATKQPLEPQPSTSAFCEKACCPYAYYDIS